MDYSYSIANDTLNGNINTPKIEKEITDLALGSASFLSTLVAPQRDLLKISFDGELNAGDKTSLDNTVGNHDGLPMDEYIFIANSSLITQPITVTQDATWEEISGVVTTPDEFISDLNEAVGRITGMIKTSGTQAQLKVLEDGSKEMLSAPYDVADTSGAWQSFQFLTDVAPASGMHEYSLMARLNGATSAEIKFTSLTLLRKIQIS